MDCLVYECDIFIIQGGYWISSELNRNNKIDVGFHDPFIEGIVTIGARALKLLINSTYVVYR